MLTGMINFSPFSPALKLIARLKGIYLRCFLFFSCLAFQRILAVNLVGPKNRNTSNLDLVGDHQK